MSQPAIDPMTFAELEEAAGADFVRELVQTFLEEAPAMLQALREARQSGDAEVFRRNAHSLKSNSLTFGALELGAQARALELGGLQAAGPASDALQALDLEWARVVAALQERARHD